MRVEKIENRNLQPPSYKCHRIKVKRVAIDFKNFPVKIAAQDSLDRDAFVDALIDFARLNQNRGFTRGALLSYFDTLHLSKSTTRSNDFVTAAQKAGQDWGFRLFRLGNLYYVNNRTARYFGFPYRKPSTAKEYCASRRGYSRRQQRNHRLRPILEPIVTPTHTFVDSWLHLLLLCKYCICSTAVHAASQSFVFDSPRNLNLNR
jgi:hypothetical protein